MKNKLNHIKIILPMLILLVLTGCTYILIPVEGPSYRGKALEVKDLKVEVIPGQYYVEFDRDDLFIPVHVIIKNNTDHTVSIREKNFLLLDDSGHKYDPASLKEVITYYSLTSLYAHPYYHGYRWWYSYHPVHWYHGDMAYNMVNMIKETFLIPYDLGPGESTAGFLYFNGAIQWAHETVTLVARFAENNKEPVEYTFIID